jgi:hypothetical protein
MGLRAGVESFLDGGVPQRLKSALILRAFTASLKRCPDTNRPDGEVKVPTLSR